MHTSSTPLLSCCSSKGGGASYVIHIVALLPVGTISTMAQTGVSGLVVVDGESFLTRSSRLLAKAEALGSTDYKSTVEVDDGSTGGNWLEALSRPRTAGFSETSNRATRS